MAADFFLFCSSLASLISWRTCCRVHGAQLQWREVHPKIIADSKHSITQYWRYDYLISMTSPEVLQPSFVPIGPCLKSPPLCFFQPLPPLQEFLLSQLLQLNARHRNVPAAKLMRHTGYLAAIVVHDVNFHLCIWPFQHVGVSKNRGTPKSSLAIGFSIINHPFWGTPIFGNPQILLKWPLFWICPHREILHPHLQLRKAPFSEFQALSSGQNFIWS